MVAVRTVMLVLGTLAASIWIGSLVCLALVARVARRTLDGRSFVVLFRDVGRLYRMVGTTSLVVAIVVALVLAWPITAAGLDLAILVATAFLVIVTTAGMMQAGRMTVRRLHALKDPHDQVAADEVRRGAAVAGLLRGLIGLSTLTIIVLGAGLVEW
jgi:hypothetical protein